MITAFQFDNGKPASLNLHRYLFVYRSLLVFLLLLLFAPLARSQDCTSYLVVNAFDFRLHEDIATLKQEDFEAKMDKLSLPIVSISQDYKSRLVVLVEVDGTKDPRIGGNVDVVTKWVRQAPDGQPVAFGIYAGRTRFTKGFVTDQKERVQEVGDVIEEENSLGERVAMFDALHQALRLFGEHQPGDTVLLVADPYDDISSHSVADIEREYLATGTRLMIMQREKITRASRDYLWSSHYPERRLFAEVPDETGGANSSDFDPHFIGFLWRGYLLGVKMPGNMHKPKKWQLKLRKTAQRSFPHSHLYSPDVVPPCTTQVAENHEK